MEKLLNKIKSNKKQTALLSVGVILLSLSLLCKDRNVVRPKSVSDAAETSVMLTDMQMKSGGTGVILKSEKNSSVILTNKHICKILQGGGLAVRNGQQYLVDSVKRYPLHDLCLVKVSRNLGVNTKVADSAPNLFSEASISGHPNLLPHVLTRGSFTGHQIITLMVGLRDCTKEDLQGPYALYCAFMGGMPILQSFEAQVVSATILPGSSGSAVYNASGEISGLVFAGAGNGLGYAYIVPWEYIVDFLSIAPELPYEPAQQLKYDTAIRSIFNVQHQCQEDTEDAKKYKNLCNSVKSYIIWNEQ